MIDGAQSSDKISVIDGNKALEVTNVSSNYT